MRAVQLLGIRLCSLAFSKQRTVRNSREERTRDWRDPEEPELPHGPSTGEHGRSGAARGIHREIRDRDANRVDQGMLTVPARCESSAEIEARLAAGDRVESAGSNNCANHGAMMYAGSSAAGKRLPAASPIETAGLRWQPEMWPIASAMVGTVSPNANATPANPMPELGNAAARTALPQPPKTSQKVPRHSARERLPSVADVSSSTAGSRIRHFRSGPPGLWPAYAGQNVSERFAQPES